MTSACIPLCRSALIGIVAVSLTGLSAFPSTQAFSATPTLPIRTESLISHDQLVADVPVSWTPAVLDGKVADITQVGSTMVVGGLFAQVSQRAGAAIDQANAFTFDATSGVINRDFDSEISGEVRAVEPGPVADTVYVAGGFAGIDGHGGRVFLLDVKNGSVLVRFDAPAINGSVTDIQLVGDELYIGGFFTQVGGQARGGLAVLDADTGVLSDALSIDLTENHNFGQEPGAVRGAVGARSLAVDPAGQTLAVIGNFRKADGLDRDQMVLIDISGTQDVVRADWRTRAYEPACVTFGWDSYVREVSFAPDGSHVVVAASGGAVPDSLCDGAARFEVGVSGDDIQPSWDSDAGGDTLLSAVTSGTAVYVGGHQRWMNNLNGPNDKVSGAVPRAGLAGVDPGNGVPFSWNPGRNPRGVGAEALTITDEGLWVGSDTEQIGNFQYRRPRLAFFPLVDGTAVGPGRTGDLPGNVYRGDPGGAGGVDRLFMEASGVPAGQAAHSVEAGDIDWSAVGGATLIDGVLYYLQGGVFYRRDFDGASYGAAAEVDPYNDPYWSTVKTGTIPGQTYQGLRPSFYDYADTVEDIAYSDGALFYTRAGSNQIYERSFVPESGVMSEPGRGIYRFSHDRDVTGLFFAPEGDALYFADIDGDLYRVEWNNGPTGASELISGPELDGRKWDSDALFLGPGKAASVPNDSPQRGEEPAVGTKVGGDIDGGTP